MAYKDGKGFFNVNLVGDTVETSDRGSTGVGVFLQDQTSPVLTVPFLQERASTSLAVDAVIGDRTVTLTAGHGALAGEILEIAEVSSGTFIQSKIIDVNVDVITIDQPINYTYLAANSIALRSTDEMLVDGSVTPQVFSVLPLPNQSGDMVRIILAITGTGAMDFEKFGSDAELTNGCVLRVKNPDGSFKNLFNFKSNGAVITQGFDYAFLENNANNVRAFSSRVTWGGQDKHGVVIRLDGGLGEELQVVIQDNLTAGTNTSFKVQAQGHEIQD